MAGFWSHASSDSEAILFSTARLVCGLVSGQSDGQRQKHAVPVELALGKAAVLTVFAQLIVKRFSHVLPAVVVK